MSIRKEIQREYRICDMLEDRHGPASPHVEWRDAARRIWEIMRALRREFPQAPALPEMPDVADADGLRLALDRADAWADEFHRRTDAAPPPVNAPPRANAEPRRK